MTSKILLGLALLLGSVSCAINETNGQYSSNPTTQPTPNNDRTASSRLSAHGAHVRFVAEPAERPSLADDGNFVDQQNAWVAGFRVKRTIDGGRDWTEMRPASEDETVFGKVAQVYLRPYFITPTRGWLKAGSGIWQTDDGGTTWRLLFPSGSNVPAFADDRHGWFNVQVGESAEQSYTTQDGGLTWQPCGSQRGYNGQHPDGTAYFLTPQLGWGVTGHTIERQTIYGVARTVDGGCSWQQLWVSNNNPDEWYADIYFINEREGWLAGKANGSLYHTTSGGKTWNSLPLPYEGSKVTHVYFANHKEGWIIINKTDGGAAAFFHTADQGQTWRQLTASEILASDGIPSKWNAGQLLRMLYVAVPENRE